jgi:hypothetical protein
MTAAEGKKCVELPRVPNGAQHRRKFSILRAVSEGDTTRFLPKVLAVESSSSKSI